MHNQDTPPAIDMFYRDFEARFRGDRATILTRLEVYRPFIAPLAERGDARALDLGCGRGEWLELLGRWGVEARGVDLDAGMLTEAKERGLSVAREDAVQALRAVPDRDLAIVSAFHLAEHLPFDVLRALVAEALRALRPGGLLILETPNPENLQVGLVNFHLDATHVRPLPPVLTGFLVEHAGFTRHAVLRLQGQAPTAETRDKLMALLTEVSLDYAVVAQKEGEEMDRLDPAFEQEIGLSLVDAVVRIDGARDERHARSRANAATLANRIAGETSRLRAEIEALHARLAEREAGDEAHQVQFAEWQAETAALRASLSPEIAEIRYLVSRSWTERLLFRRCGRPIKALRRLLFHTSGKPRGIFRRWVVDKDRNPRPAFRRWMESPRYLALRWPASRQPILAPTPAELPPVEDHPLRGVLIARLEEAAARAALPKVTN
ncbi:O-antigen chain-terminating methyltransferase [Hasllibacter halocynthiae]|uniref:O-antigen chain-terminating methyltransferase n=1 Tax=Hasllibacter halocynthiae TaxID=595589 RepID=A0A2T0X1M4_9RHOB|nr:class I SAM-dependent methyltransferase [Hasllibacter halocynthiae]PRY92817.1 O-antigen chain-terminating methyltransferase [Hasllibacter halocynthiae]